MQKQGHRLVCLAKGPAWRASNDETEESTHGNEREPKMVDLMMQENNDRECRSDAQRVQEIRQLIIWIPSALTTATDSWAENHLWQCFTEDYTTFLKSWDPMSLTLPQAGCSPKGTRDVWYKTLSSILAHMAKKVYMSVKECCPCAQDRMLFNKTSRWRCFLHLYHWSLFPSTLLSQYPEYLISTNTSIS